MRAGLPGGQEMLAGRPLLAQQPLHKLLVLLLLLRRRAPLQMLCEKSH